MLAVNYKYLLQKCSNYIQTGEEEILDFGCGDGEFVKEGRAKGINLYGVDVFYKGGVNLSVVKEKGLFGNSIFKIEDNKIPFEDNRFDIVVSNMVFEHVDNLDMACQEISRTLKPGGVLISMFPIKETFLEGHCSIYFSHWITTNLSLRYYYLLFFRCLGFGANKEDNKNYKVWAKYWSNWISDYTFYRNKKEIIKNIQKYFKSIQFIEEDNVSFRLKTKKMLLLANVVKIPIIRDVVRYLFTKFGHAVIVCKV